MVYEIYKRGSYQVIAINEVLCLTSDLTELEDIVNDFLGKGLLNIAIRFTDGSYLHSATGSILLHCWENIKDKKGNLALINVNKDIRDFLAIIDFDSLIGIYDTDEELALFSND